jgi:hypothetical protein
LTPDICERRPIEPYPVLQTLVARGAVLAARVARVPAVYACLQLEQAAIAIRTKKGWFAAPRGAPMYLRELSGVSVPRASLRWVSAGAVEVIEQQFTELTTSTEYRMGAGHSRVEVTVRDETRWVVWCGVGQSGVPSCSSPVVLSCAERAGEATPQSSVAVSYSDGAVTLTSNADPDTACAQAGPLTVGAFTFNFP